MRYFLISLMLAGCAYGQLTVSKVERGTQRPGDLVVTNVTLTGVVYTNDATYTGTVAKAASAFSWGDHSLAGYVKTNETAGVRLNTLIVTNGIRAADGSVSVDTQNRYLYDANGKPTVNWGEGVLIDSSNTQSIDWGNRAIVDASGLTSMAWGDRNLQYSNYEFALDWATPGVFKVGGSLTVNGTNVMTEIAGKVGTNRTITVNGTTGTLTSNLSFTVTAGITGATVTNIVNAFTFTNQTWSAAGTNATYRIYWDITNGTFGVQEILP